MITDFDSVKTWLGEPAIPDDVIMAAYQAADSYVDSRTIWEPESLDPDPDPPPAPDDLVLAVNLLTARYLARRNSPDGIVGLGDLGPANVPVIDRDPERLMDPWRFFPVA